MKVALLGLALLGSALLGAVPAAHAQVIIQAPPPPGVIVGRPPGPPPPGYGPDYWRRGEREDWRRRTEFREDQHRRYEWRRAHCVRGYDGHEYCRP